MDSETRKLLHARLEKIRAKSAGVLTPDEVVKDARSESSPLHSYFTWDDSEAAHQFRLDQARTLIRNVRVEVETTTKTIAAPFYVRDPRVGSGEQGYASVAEIRTEVDVAADALKYEFDRAIGAFERAVVIADALGMSDQVADLLTRTRTVQQTVKTAGRESTTKEPRRKKVAV